MKQLQSSCTNWTSLREWAKPAPDNILLCVQSCYNMCCMQLPSSYLIRMLSFIFQSSLSYYHKHIYHRQSIVENLSLRRMKSYNHCIVMSTLADLSRLCKFMKIKARQILVKRNLLVKIRFSREKPGEVLQAQSSYYFPYADRLFF